MNLTTLFIVRAKTKRGNIVYFLTDFNALIEHNHLDVVQYYNVKTHKWIDYDDIKQGTELATNICETDIPLSQLGGKDGNTYLGLEVEFSIKDSNGNEIYNKISTGNPCEYYRYLKKNLTSTYDCTLNDLTYDAKIIDFENWYNRRKLNEKRKNSSLKNFTIVHV